MSKNTKIITKIIMIILITLGILLILPTTTRAIIDKKNQTNDITFSYWITDNEEDSFTIKNVPNNHFYTLAYDLMNSSSIEDFDENDNGGKYWHKKNLGISWDGGICPESNDGYYVPGGGRANGCDYVHNVFCTDPNSGCLGGPNDEGSILYTIDITPEKVVCNGKTNGKHSDLLNQWAEVLYKSSSTKLTYSENGRVGLFDGLYWTHYKLNDLKSEIASTTGIDATWLGKQYDQDSVFDSSYEWSANEKYHARIYVIYGGGMQQTRIVFKVDKVDIPEVSINLKKQNLNNTALSNAKIQVTAGSNAKDFTKNLKSDTDGSFGKITVKPKENTGKFEINLKETTAPTGYIGLSKEVKLTVYYNKTTGEVTKIESNNSTYVPDQSSGNVIVKNAPAVKLNFEKQDFNNKVITGATIKVTKGENVTKIEGLNSSGNLQTEDGKYKQIKVYPSDYTKGYFKLTLKETAPQGYSKFEGDITLTVYYNKTTGEVTKIESNNSTYVPDQSSGNVIVKNPPKIDSLILYKIDSLTRKALEGAKFKITLTNVKSVGSYSSASKSGKITLTDVTTDKDGKLKIGDLVFDGSATQITIRIEETETPDTDEYYYKKIDPIEFTIQYSVSNGKATFKLLNAPKEVSINGNEVTLNVENVPLIKLSGMVWLDGQIGEKNVSVPNGRKDSGEEGIDGVSISLYSLKTGTIKKWTTTSNGGEYKFEDIEKTNEGYIIQFRYNGINYIATNKDVNGNKIENGFDYDTIDSDATEVSRDVFNSKFKTISNSRSNTVPLGYEYDSKEEKSTLQIYNPQYPENKEIGIMNPANRNSADFRMIAQTEAYKDTTTKIDCGLVKKEFDLAIGTDIVSSRLEINGKQTTYTYNQLMDGGLDLDEILQGKSSDLDGISYNLYLYKSDYNYRIGDYKTGIENTVNPSDSNNIYKETDGDNNNDTIKELETYVKYNVILKGQTTQNSTVNEFVYYYDPIYKPYNIQSTDKYDVSIDETNRKITFTSKNDGLKITNPNYRVEVELEFVINKDSKDYKNLMNSSYTAKNITEITKYSTDEGGLIDRDSAPGNGITNGVITQYEDDTDESKGLNISLKNESRTITGTVFKDTNKDGINNDNVPVNDVIVQLIEIKKRSGKYYEYIWQETRSGHNVVKKLSEDGNTIDEITYNTTVGDGEYLFTGYIPGYYIIRYIYGDGTIYDLTDNIKTYNGQDYKSTIDKSYNEEWYNTSNYTSGQSVARDNEARRLEVMAYSTTIDKDIGKALNEKTTLDKTWMAAETSRVDVPIEGEDSTTPTPNNTVSFGNMNFGLAERPKTSLVLEKHITGLKITPSGTGVQPIVDARASIDDILESNEIKTTGVTQGLATNKSTRGNRGFWQVATDVEELTQGAQLEVEYTYVIENKGEDDYLSSTLVDKYKENQEGYSAYLANTAAGIKNTLKGNTNKYGEYLGQYYYNGDANNCELVPTRIEASGLEEALNNDLSFDSETSGEDFNKANSEAVEKRVYDTNGAPQKENIETVIANSSASEFLTPDNNTDYSKKVTLRKILSASSGGELGANLPSYIAEIVKYSNAAGRRDIEATPENLSYVHSDDKEMTLESVTVKDNGEVKEISKEDYNQNKDKYELIRANEEDEFWGETIIITKPTGEDKITPMQIAIITVASIATLGVGIILIKKFVLKK